MTSLNSLTKLLGIGLLAAMFSCSAFAADAPKMGADKHVAKGVACQTCHGTDLKNPNLPTEETCTQCHPKAAVIEYCINTLQYVSMEMLIEKTKDLPGANPHNAPHNGDCINCHLMHEPPEDYCAQCHKFNFKVK